MNDAPRSARAEVRIPGVTSAAPALSSDLAPLRAQLLHAVQRVCPPWLAAQREDIVQAALLRVLKTLEGRESIAPLPSSYLWKAAYSATVDEIRRARRRPEVALDEVPVVESLADGGTDPFEDQAVRELGAAIRECLAGLGEPRRIVVGFHLMGHKVGEMVNLLGWDEKRLRNLLSRGLVDLRRCLAERGVQP